ncbi:MAG: hypothetical protein NTY41_00415 [Proteobacteria bacterium]|nr:hypothetical protein [Pseudomonadota bacterium]
MKHVSRYVEDPLIRSMRVRTWFQAVKQASCPTLANRLVSAQLEREFSEREQAPAASTRSCIWDKYKRGEVVPRSGSRRSGRLGMVERVERRCPGTAAWLNSPLWRMADKAPMEISELRRLYDGMGNDMRNFFIVDCAPSGLFWRRWINAEDVCSRLALVDRVDALIILLALAKEAETIQDQRQHALAVEAVRENILLPTITKNLGKKVCVDLSRYLDRRWRNPGYFGPTEIGPKKTSV